MVATRGKDVRFVLGEGSINPSSLTPDEWKEIISSAVNHLAAKYLRGFHPVDYILEQIGSFQGTGVKPVISTDALCGALGINSPNVFLHCCAVIGRPSVSNWPEVASLDSAKGNIYVPAESSHVLLGRNDKFYLLRATWEVRIKSTGQSSRPDIVKWLEATKSSIVETDCVSLMAEHPEREIGLKILRALHDAQARTTNDLRGQYDYALNSEAVLAGYLKRLGQSVK